MSHFDSEGREQQDRRTSSAFQWPSPSQTPLLYSDISIKDILDTYQHDVELLKVILLAKAEEDKKRTAEENCKAEEARLRAKTIELELLRESKAPSSAGAHFTHPSDPQLPVLRPNVTSIPDDRHASPMSLISDRFVPTSTGSPNSFTYAEPFGTLFSSLPNSSPEHTPQLSTKKDHFSESDKHMDFFRDPSIYKHQVDTEGLDFGNPLSPSSRIPSHYESRQTHKRSHSMASSRSLMGSSSDIDPENVPHEQVMEALRAKIQRTRNQPGPSTVRHQPPLRHRRSHSAAVQRSKGEVSSRSPSTDSISVPGELSASPHESGALIETEVPKEPIVTSSLKPIQEFDTAITNVKYDTNSQDEQTGNR
ncbi:unnamed protein product [Umbelopsis ramanniana]